MTLAVSACIRSRSLLCFECSSSPQRPLPWSPGSRPSFQLAVLLLHLATRQTRPAHRERCGAWGPAQTKQGGAHTARVSTPRNGPRAGFQEEADIRAHHLQCPSPGVVGLPTAMTRTNKRQLVFATVINRLENKPAERVATV